MALDRGVWIDGGDPAYGMLEDELVTIVLFDVRDPRLTPEYLRGVLRKVPKIGLFMCSQGDGWPSSGTVAPAAWADWAYKQVLEITAPLGEVGKQIRAVLNCETHEAAWILPMLKRWRAHNPKRGTCWSMEANQADLFAAHKVELRQRGIIAGPQCYVVTDEDPMARVESGHEVTAWSKIVGADRVSPFLDGAKLGHWWEGVAFTQGRMLGA